MKAWIKRVTAASVAYPVGLQYQGCARIFLDRGEDINLMYPRPFLLKSPILPFPDSIPNSQLLVYTAARGYLQTGENCATVNIRVHNTENFQIKVNK